MVRRLRGGRRAQDGATSGELGQQGQDAEEVSPAGQRSVEAPLQKQSSSKDGQADGAWTCGICSQRGNTGSMCTVCRRARGTSLERSYQTVQEMTQSVVDGINRVQNGGAEDVGSDGLALRYSLVRKAQSKVSSMGGARLSGGLGMYGDLGASLQPLHPEARDVYEELQPIRRAAPWGEVANQALAGDLRRARSEAVWPPHGGSAEKAFARTHAGMQLPGPDQGGAFREQQYGQTQAAPGPAGGRERLWRTAPPRVPALPASLPEDPGERWPQRGGALEASPRRDAGRQQRLAAVGPPVLPQSWKPAPASAAQGFAGVEVIGARHASEGGAASPDGWPSSGSRLALGATVSIEGLVGASHLNGSTGLVRSIDPQAARVFVELPNGALKAVQAEKVRLQSADRRPGAASSPSPTASFGGRHGGGHSASAPSLPSAVAPEAGGASHGAPGGRAALPPAAPQAQAGRPPASGGLAAAPRGRAAEELPATAAALPRGPMHRSGEGQVSGQRAAPPPGAGALAGGSSDAHIRQSQAEARMARRAVVTSHQVDGSLDDPLVRLLQAQMDSLQGMRSRLTATGIA